MSGARSAIAPGRFVLGTLEKRRDLAGAVALSPRGRVRAGYRHAPVAGGVVSAERRAGNYPAAAAVWAGRFRLAFSAVALALSVGASWLNGSGTPTTLVPSSGASSLASSWGQPQAVSFMGSGSLALQSCESLPGSVPLPEDLPDGWSVPSWVDSGDLPECVPLDVSGLREPVASPAPEPSPSPEPPSPDLVTEATFTERLDRLTALVLYSGGLMICCLAALVFRSRGGR